MSYENPRLELSDTMLSAIVKFSESNPGAFSVLSKVAEKASEIDPDDAFGPYGTFFNLDNLDVYGGKIWILYKDICGQNISKFIGLNRCVQLGLMKEGELRQAIADERMTKERLDELMGLLLKRLPNFKITP